MVLLEFVRGRVAEAGVRSHRVVMLPPRVKPRAAGGTRGDGRFHAGRRVPGRAPERPRVRYDCDGCDYSDRTVVLGFSSLDEHRIRAGIQGIADALADLPAMSRRSSVASAAALVVSSRRPTSGSHRPSRSGRRPRH